MIYSIIAVIIMSLMTYLPRVIPIAFFRKKINNIYIKSFLFYVPYAVLAAMTFPAVFYFTDNIVVTSVATAVAVILSFFRQKLIVVALVSSIVVFGLLLLYSYL